AGFGCGGQACDRAGILRDFGAHQNNVQIRLGRTHRRQLQSAGDAQRIPAAFQIYIEKSGVVGFEAVAQMVVGGTKEARASVAALDARVEHVVGADLERVGIERLAGAVVQDHREAAQLVILECLDDVGCVLDGDRRAFLGDLQIVAAVGIAPDALAEEERDARVVDALVVAVPVAVAPKRDLYRFDGIKARPRHYLLFLTAVEDDRYRAVVDEIYFHHRAELTRLDFNIASAGEREKVLVEAARFVGRGGFDERWAAAGVGVGEQRELRHDQHRAADLGERAVHLAGVVGEYAHAEDSIRQMSRVGFGVAVGNAQQHNESTRNFAHAAPVDAHLGAADALNNCPHSSVIYD